MKEIKLTTGDVALVDDVWYDTIMSYSPWSCCAGKAARSVGDEIEYMHHVILPKKIGFDVDHRDTNGLNNQSYNLRYLFHFENIHNRPKQSNNTTGFIGVRWSNSAKGYQSYTSLDGKRYHHGTFKTAKEAAIVRDDFVKKHLPNVATLNFP